MNAFQVLGIVLCSGFALVTLVAISRKRLQALPGLAWALLWSLAAVAIARPELTVVAARALGIQRGADLIFYLAILGALAGFFLLYVRMRRLDEGLTAIVRQLAIDGARTPDTIAGDDDSNREA